MEIVGIIPARYQSSRFPGKPLAEICGKPMIYWVYSQTKKVKELNEVYVATDDKKIEEACKENNINVIMTSSKHKTGTDRIGEVAETIRKAILPFYDDRNLEVTNLMTKIKDPVDALNFTVPKVITNKDNIGIYLTRAMAPYPKGKIDYNFYKQVCVYGFKPDALEFFCNSERGKIESIEDIEILRFIESGYKVQYIEVESETVAVDTPNDLEKVRKIMEEKQ